ncbi:hypothetical protein L917_14360 [Phytophthora nicotianae]|uniref:RWP-RK domain-containing protein n=2 Tax=Phytophthora nicotianae TaxID=4792 RepID=V9EJC1_PHYNI|nr:hypothetical protein F443_15083 [Phytophthora nicotianae P1569]ETL86191.1 hypothetical protein L917_14360 [Phytophthora nicotianae]
MKAFTPPHSPPSSKKEIESIQPVPKSRRKYDFSIKTLQEYSHYRQDDAAKLLGVAPITLKRICHRRKYRWPYRTIKARLRRSALAAQTKKTTEALATRMTTPSSPSLVAPELLLSLSKERKTFNSSPTAVSDVASTPMVCSPKARYPLTSEMLGSNQLPPLTWVLQRHRMQPLVTPPQRYHPMNYKSSFYSASFPSTAPKFPIRTMLGSKMHEMTLQLLLERSQSRHLSHQTNL